MKRILLAGWLTLVLASSAQAGMLAVDGFNLGTAPTNFSNRTLGWSFTANETLIVDSLGFWDNGSNGLVAAHQVGIWDGTGSTLLGTVTVQQGTGSAVMGPVIAGGSFRFESLATPIVLDQGQNYIIGAYTNNSDSFATLTSGLTTSSDITFLQSRRSPFQSGFIAPLPNDPADGTAYFGPNFTFTAVPEPSTFALLGIGGLALVGYGWRRKRQRVA